MPYGKGTYGSKRGRPPKKNKKVKEQRSENLKFIPVLMLICGLVNIAKVKWVEKKLKKENEFKKVDI